MWRMGGGGSRKKWNHPHEPGLFVPKCTAVLGNLKAHTRAMQSSGCAGLDRLSFPWRARRCAKGQGQRLLQGWPLYPRGSSGAPVCLEARSRIGEDAVRVIAVRAQPATRQGAVCRLSLRLGLCVGDSEARADGQCRELIDGTAASAPVRKLLFVETLGHTRVPLAGYRLDHHAGVELAAIDAHRAAEAAADLERRLDDGVAREARRDRLEIRDCAGAGCGGRFRSSSLGQVGAQGPQFYADKTVLPARVIAWRKGSPGHQGDSRPLSRRLRRTGRQT